LIKNNISILAIESSCDDTSVAVLTDGVIKSNQTSTQIVHQLYGGVVPELASRQHLIQIVPLVDKAIKDAGLELREIDAVAFTRGPGLLGSLIVGVSMAKALALALDVPLIDVHHMHAHVLAHFAADPAPSFPFLCLTVSGGHTQIVQVNDYTNMTMLGSTIDDAAGEAFDKTGKMLGLDYPAGPLIDKLAASGKHVFKFPEPVVEGFNFSFSGLKTSILYFLKKAIANDPNFIQDNLNDICCSVQTTIVQILLKKLKMASDHTGIKEIGIAGGVSANRFLRQTFEEEGIKNGWNTYVPAFEYCTDNAGMIAIAGYYKYLKGDFCDQSVTPLARMEF